MAAGRTFRVGVWLVAAGYALWFVMALLGRLAPLHPEHAAEAAPYVATWPTSLVYSLTLVEILVALLPLARGERWAHFAGLLPVLAVGIPHVIEDPRCFANLFSQHGCHTFLASMLFIFIGLLLTAKTIYFSRKVG
jgi:hypothetical protein